MQPASLLARPGIDKETRILIGIATATWRADWPAFSSWATCGQQLPIARSAIEETLLQCVLFCGFPRVISAFGHLNKGWPTETEPSGGALPEADQIPAGDKLFQAIYGKHDAAVRGMLKSCHHELHDFVLESAYGRILSRPNLTSRARELIAAAVLAAQSQERQFAGHARGALHLGATRGELTEALVTAFAEAPDEVDGWISRIPPGS